MTIERERELADKLVAVLTRQRGHLADLLREVVDHQRLCCGTLAPLDEWADLVGRIQDALAVYGLDSPATADAGGQCVALDKAKRCLSTLRVAAKTGRLVSDFTEVLHALEVLLPQVASGGSPAAEGALAGPVPGPAVPEGWQLVPVEPTREMREAFHVAHEQWESGRNWRLDSPDHQWSAMLAAAPKGEWWPV